ncbi:MAG TPA: tetratricopeptide repeat protein [Candidatus Choladousia intestinigallinarum]|nr:tetratricopeptide repeat protein [Candidatus Choladousia intestinigallinarum]
MRCVYCNTPLAAIDYCPGCGADITIQKRIMRISNLLYNQGLEKARIRDMDGAIACLKRSLKFNKENIDARNLLGLCYFETGEAVSALCEWVVSKNMKGEDNLADHYIDMLQSNKNRLDVMNQTIRKYNQSVMYCREDNEDMAIIQLKKVISQNPKLVKAYQLLALLYMKRQEYERARRLLKKTAQIDATNTTTLRYLQEIEEATGKGTNLSRRHKKYEREQEEGGISGTLRYMSGTEMVIQPTTFRDSSTIATFINIILGLLLGGAIVWFLVVPANRQSVNDQANQQVTDANTKLASESARVQELEEEIDGYLQQVDAAKQEQENANTQVQSYDDLLAIANLYISGDQSTAASMITTLNAEDFEGNAKTLYESLSGAVQSSLFTEYYTAGTQAYSNGDYSTAAAQLQQAVDADTNRENANYAQALFYLGFAYYNLGNYNQSDQVFNQFTTYYPDRAGEVQPYIVGGTSGTQQNVTGAADVSGLGDAATGQNAAGTGGQNTGQSETNAAGTDMSGAGTTNTGDGNAITIY